MGRDLSPAERRELLGVYALGALGDDERAQVEDLLLRDASARAELHTLQLGVAWMDHASTRAPMHVWRRIEDEIAAERVDEVAAPSEVVPFAPRARRPAARGRWLAVAAAVVAVLAVAVGLLVGTRSEGGSRTTVAAAASAAARTPNAQRVAMVDAGGTTAGRVVVADGRAYVVWSDPPTASTGTYQLWEITPTGPRSAGLLGRTAADRSFAISPSASAIAVTLEPRGGSAAPTSTPIVVATLA